MRFTDKSLFAISQADIAFISTALYGKPRAAQRDRALERLYSVRDRPMPPEKQAKSTA